MTGADLQQFVQNVNWMRYCIPQHSERVQQPSWISLRKTININMRRTRRGANYIRLTDTSWGDTLMHCFEDIQKALVCSLT